jgi:VWFA-related protein
MRLALLSIAASLIAVSALAQSEAMVNPRVVEFPVTVLDVSGNPVRRLTAANFAVYDEKRKQPITSFDVVDFADAQGSAIAPMTPAARRSFVLLFDLGFLSPRALSRAQDAARRFVNQSVGARDLVAVVTVHPDHGFRFLTAFTTDRLLVASAIDNPVSFRSSDPLQLANQTVEWSDREPAGSQSGAESIADPSSRDLALPAGSNDPAIRQRVEHEIDSIDNLARSLRMVPGRKQVVLLSEGFDTHLLQSAGTHDSKEPAATNSQIDRMAERFRTSNVVLDAIDMQDVRVQNKPAGTAIRANASLFLMSRPTGGEVLQNSNELRADFVRLLHHQEIVYTLGFHVPDNAPGMFHNVSVKLVNAPEGARVSQGAGYFERGRDTPVERALTNAQIVVNDLLQHDLRLNVLAAPFPPVAAAKRAQVPIIIDINGADLIRETSATIGGADIFVYAFDANGIVRDRLYDRVTLEVGKVGEKVRASGIRYYGTLMLAPGNYALKAFVRTGDPDRGPMDVSEKRGYARVNVNVPAEGQIAILPLIPIDEDGKWLFVRNNRGENAAYPFEFGGKAFRPTPIVDLSGGPRKIALFIFGAHPAELTIESRPHTRVLGMTEANGVTKVVLQLEHAEGASSLDVTVFKKGVAAGQHTGVPLM